MHTPPARSLARLSCCTIHRAEEAQTRTVRPPASSLQHPARLATTWPPGFHGNTRRAVILMRSCHDERCALSFADARSMNSGSFDTLTTLLRGNKASDFAAFLEANKDKALQSAVDDNKKPVIFAPLDTPETKIFESIATAKDKDETSRALVRAHILPAFDVTDSALKGNGFSHVISPSRASVATLVKVAGSLVTRVDDMDSFTVVYCLGVLPHLSVPTDMLAQQIYGVCIFPLAQCVAFADADVTVHVSLHDADTHDLIRGGVSDEGKPFKNGVPFGHRPTSFLPLLPKDGAVLKQATFGGAKTSFLKLVGPPRVQVTLRFSLLAKNGDTIAFLHTNPFEIVPYSAALRDDVKARRHAAMNQLGIKLPQEQAEKTRQEARAARKRRASEALDDAANQGNDSLAAFAAIASCEWNAR